MPSYRITWCSNVLAARPFNEEEKRSKSPQVLSCHDQRREVTVCQNIASKQIDRTFTFDKVRLSYHPLRLRPWLDCDCEVHLCKIGHHWQLTLWNCILGTGHCSAFLLQTFLEYWENPEVQYEISIIVFLSQLLCFCLVISTLSLCILRSLLECHMNCARRPHLPVLSLYPTSSVTDVVKNKHVT